MVISILLLSTFALAAEALSPLMTSEDSSEDTVIETTEESEDGDDKVYDSDQVDDSNEVVDGNEVGVDEFIDGDGVIDDEGYEQTG